MDQSASSHESPVDAGEQRGRRLDLPIAARRHPLAAEVRRRLVRYAGVTGSARIVVGVSGGPDSIALLLTLLTIREQRASDVHPLPIVAHVNHHLRDDADDDADCVRSLADRFGVPFALRDIHPASEGENLAAAARTLRYAALADIAREHEAQIVAVAHHGEDQLESMLMALCRGSGLDGITAMAWSRPMHDDNSGVRLIRPLLASRKHDCESLCAAAEVSWREDPSNLDRARRRNRLREEVVPVLESCWPDASVRAAGTAELMREAVALIEAKLAAHFGSPDCHKWPRAALASLSPVMIAAGLRRAVRAELSPHDAHRLDAVSQRVVLPAAEAVADNETAPRQFALTSDLLLKVRAHTVTLCRVT